MPTARAQVALIWKRLDPEFSESCPVGSYWQQVGDPTVMCVASGRQILTLLLWLLPAGNMSLGPFISESMALKMMLGYIVYLKPYSSKEHP